MEKRVIPVIILIILVIILVVLLYFSPFSPLKKPELPDDPTQENVGGDELDTPEHTAHSFGAWKRNDDVAACSINAYYRQCTGCSYVEWRNGDIAHTYDSSYSYNEDCHWFECLACNKKQEVEAHASDDEGICTTCTHVVHTDFIYHLSEDGSYSYLASYQGEASEIEIAEKYMGVPVTRIGNLAKYDHNKYGVFYNNSYITSVIIPDSITMISKSAFYNCGRLTDIKLPDSITVIGDSAFHGCIGLKDIVLGERVTSIGDYAFENCSYLNSIVIPDSVTSLGNGAFKNCSRLTNAVIGNGVSRIGGGTFNRCSRLTSVVIGDSVTSIGYTAFCGCSELINVMIGNSVTTIEDEAFRECRSLPRIVFPDSVTTIGSYAFKDCISLGSISIGKGTTSISYNAFENCQFIYVIYNNSNIQLQTGKGIANYALAIVNNGNVTYAKSSQGYEFILTDDSFLFAYKNGKYELITYSGTKETITLPEKINGNDYEINRMRGVVNVIIPDSINDIGKRAFLGCQSLRNVVIGNGITTIYIDNFCGCSNLRYIEIGDSVTSIEGGAFAGCQSLTSVLMPSSITLIGERAFRGCSNLTDIYYTGTEEEWANIEIDNSYGSNDYLLNATIHYNYVPEE